MTIETLRMSLCILTHNRRQETDALIASVAKLRGVDLEICIADQASDPGDAAYFRDISDHFATVTDRQLWDLGFGFAKQQAVDLATNDWVIVGDPGEVWHENLLEWERGLVGAIDHTHQKVLCFRVLRGRAALVKEVLEGAVPALALKDDNGRVFRKSQMKLLGLIHEAPVHKATGVIWANWARLHPAVALVEHEAHHDEDAGLTRRKQVLYDHLIDKIVRNPQLRFGTDHYWWDEYYHTIVAPRFRPHTFEEWQRIGG